MRLASWLFLKDSQSIWVERLAERSLITAGPGPTRQQRDFISEAALEAFEMALAERLAADGWFLWGVDRDRRRAARPASTGMPLPSSHALPERRRAAIQRRSEVPLTK